MKKLEQIEQLEKMCERIEREQPKRRCLSSDDFRMAYWKGEFTTHIKNIDKDIRDGVVFYSSGWGWRLRLNWRETLQAKKVSITSASS